MSWDSGRTRQLATIVAAVSLVLAGASVVLLGIGIARGWVAIDRPDVAETLPAVTLFALTFPVVGWVINRRLPGNRVGWVYLAVGFWQALNMFASGYSNLDFETARAHLPLAAELSWLAVWAWVPGFTLFTTLGVVLFPNGRLPSRRWWPVVALAAVALILQAVPTAIATWQYRGAQLEAAALLNGSPAPSGDAVLSLAQVLQTVGQLVLLLAMIGSVAGLAARFRRSGGEERQQLKWFTYAAIVDVIVLIAWMTIGLDAPAAFLSAIVFAAALPTAIGIAILRYRLYEIDVLVNRTVVYGTVTAVLVAVFGLANLALQRIAETVTRQHSDLVAAALGVGAGLAFAPVRRRVRPVVDRFLPSRALLTLLFTDIVGSTRTIVELGDERWRGLLGRYLAAVRQELARLGGREVNTAGDAFFATFSRPAAGLECAWAIRSAVKRLGLETRTGIHIGECEMRGEQVSGLAVHTAARVMAEAGDGEILVSDAFRAAIAGANVELADRGRHELKGVPGEWQLYAAEAEQGLP
jgi:class 3 adenylate cyclase